MCIFGSAALSKVLDLHHFWQKRYIDCGLRCFGVVVPFEYFIILWTHRSLYTVSHHTSAVTHLMEGPLVPILLEELLLALWFVLSEFVGTFHIFPQPLLLRKCASPFNLLSLFLTSELFLFFLLDSRELSETPRLELYIGVEPIGIVYVLNYVLFLLYTCC